MANSGKTVSRPSRYTGLDRQYIGGTRRLGRAGRTLRDSDPYTGETLAEIGLANQDDVDEAYRSAAKAQPAWAAMLPAERAGIMRRSAVIMEERHEEIVSWLVRESGSTRVKAEQEWWFVHGVTLEAASLPYRITGRINPIDEPGQESRVYRHPVASSE